MADSGIALDEDFDLLIDDTGDVGAVDDVAELQKDVATDVEPVLENQLIGTRTTENDIVGAESAIQSSLSGDSRINQILRVDITKSNVRGEVEAVIELSTIYEDDTQFTFENGN